MVWQSSLVVHRIHRRFEIVVINAPFAHLLYTVFVFSIQHFNYATTSRLCIDLEFSPKSTTKLRIFAPITSVPTYLCANKIPNNLVIQLCIHLASRISGALENRLLLLLQWDGRAKTACFLIIHVSIIKEPSLFMYSSILVIKGVHLIHQTITLLALVLCWTQLSCNINGTENEPQNEIWLLLSIWFIHYLNHLNHHHYQRSQPSVKYFTSH